MEALLKTKVMKRTFTYPTWVGWTPLCVLTLLGVFLRGSIPPWALMWILSITIFVGFKWWTWWRAVSRGIETTLFRSFAYLCLWPGMDARRFLELTPYSKTITATDWCWAFCKIVFGAGLVWGIARLAGLGLLAGWIGMVGVIFLLHFGLFAVLSLVWQRAGICALPLMNCPIAATSLGDFWGKRWNSGFRDIVFGLFFRRLAKRFGTTAAAIITFVVSGVIHEVVITFPTEADYGLPTFYFTLQGAGLLLERSPMGTHLGLENGRKGRTFAIAVVILPIFALFPPPFVLQVMVPFLQIIKALP
jgi:hypothetical protein